MANYDNNDFSGTYSPFLDSELLEAETSVPEMTFEMERINSPFFFAGLERKNLNEEIDEYETEAEFESNYGAEATKEKVRWYQTILKKVAGFPQIPVNGNHNDVATKNAMRNFHKLHNFKNSSYLKVESNRALTQMALQRIYYNHINNEPGKRGKELIYAIKRFQKDFKLSKVDGKVGPATRKAMLEVLTGKKSFPLTHYRPKQIKKSKKEIPALNRQQPDYFLGEVPGILNGENRQPQCNTIKSPNKWICLFNITYNYLKPELSQAGGIPKLSRPSLGGTGLLISPKHILTAAHVLENFTSDNPNLIFKPSAIRVMPGFNGSFRFTLKKSERKLIKPFGIHSTKRNGWQISENWESVFNKTIVRYNGDSDFALITLKSPIDKITKNKIPLGFWGKNKKYEILESYPEKLNGKKICSIGYPERIPKVKSTCKRKRWMQWKAIGEVRNELANNRTLSFKEFIHTADTTNSQSGSPIWTEEGDKKKLVGIVKEARTDNKYNLGLALTNVVLNQIVKWAPDTFEFKDGKLVAK